MVVLKPSGLLSVPGRLAEHHDSIISRIRTIHPQAMAVHRLDMDTSGIMVVGLAAKAISALGKSFQRKEVSKEYLALVSGLIDKRGRVDLPIRCDLEHRPLQIVDFEQGKESHTLYERVDSYRAAPLFKHENTSLVRLIPQTGRSHQLRVHMASIGHPILGDRFYADENSKSLAPRLCLHAAGLSFVHPFSMEKLSFYRLPEFVEKID